MATLGVKVVPGASCYAVCGWLELLAAD